MPRPMVLVFLLLVLIITSQFEWKQQFPDEAGLNLNLSQKQEHIHKKEEIVKEKIILSQEKNIQRLNELVQNLREQLLQCRSGKSTVNGSGSSLTADMIELE